MKGLILLLLLANSAFAEKVLDFDKLTQTQISEVEKVMETVEEVRVRFISEGLAISVATGRLHVEHGYVCRAYKFQTGIGSRTGTACFDNSIGWIYQ